MIQGQNIAFPYRLIPDSMVDRSEWVWSMHRSDGDAGSTEVDSWDYDSKLSISRTIKLNITDCLAKAGLDDDAQLGLVTVLETGPTGYRWTASQMNISAVGEWSETTRIKVDSGKLASALKIYTDIVLLNAGASFSKMAATQTGSRLWGDSHKIDLEGTSARFPMDILDFKKALPSLRAPAAKWYLHWQPDQLEGSFVGNVVLCLNSMNPKFVERVLGNDPASVSWITFDVIRQMCSQLLESEEFIANFDNYEDGSVGGVVKSWFQHGFKDMTIDTVRSLYQQNRPWFEARLLSVYGGDDV
jgi:hypothetical protein